MLISGRGALIAFSLGIASTFAMLLNAEAFERHRGTYALIDLNAGADTSEARAINNKGQIVGFHFTFSDIPEGCCDVIRAFLWDNGVFTDLGNLSGTQTGNAFPVAINNHGQVVGISDQHAFLWQDGVMKDLGTLGGFGSSAYAVNDRGQVVGWADTSFSSPFAYHAFLWERGVIRDLGTLPGAVVSIATHINGRGQVAGHSTTPSGVTNAFVWTDGVLLDIGTLGGEGASPLGIKTFINGLNDRGQAVGYSLAPSGEYHAFLWENGVMTDLGPPNAVGEATAINNRGQIVGFFGATTGNARAFVWENGIRTELPTLGAFGTFATGINDHGKIIGQTIVAIRGLGVCCDYRAFVFDNGVITELSALSGQFSDPLDINNRGQIIGLSSEPSVIPHAVLWQQSK